MGNPMLNLTSHNIPSVACTPIRSLTCRNCGHKGHSSSNCSSNSPSCPNCGCPHTAFLEAALSLSKSIIYARSKSKIKFHILMLARFSILRSPHLQELLYLVSPLPPVLTLHCLLLSSLPCVLLVLFHSLCPLGYCP